MSWNYVSIEKHGRIAVVRFDRADNKNAMSMELMRELHEAARSFEGDIETSAIVLSCGASQNFSVGFDLRDPANTVFLEGDFAKLRKALKLGRSLCRAWEELESVTVAAIEGWCVGGGLCLSLACDIRVAGAGAIFYAAEVERGMNLSWGAVPRLVNLVGPAKSKRIAAMAEKIDAKRAVAWGLAEELTPAGQAYAKAMEMAAHTASLPPVQVRMCKQAVSKAATVFNEATSFMDVDQYMLAVASEDAKEAMRAFLEKRRPKFTGR